MRVETVKLSGYRRLADAEIEFREGLNLIVGPNNSGKTSLLQALAVLLGTGTPGHPGDNWARDQTTTGGACVEAVLRPSEEEWRAVCAHLNEEEERLEPGKLCEPQADGEVSSWPSGAVTRVICDPRGAVGHNSGLLPEDDERAQHGAERKLSPLAGRLAGAFYRRDFSREVLVAPVYLGGGARHVGPADARPVGIAEYGREHAAPGGRLSEYTTFLGEEEHTQYVQSLERVMGSDFVVSANYQASSAQVRMIVQDTPGWLLDADWQGSGAQWVMVVLAVLHGASWGPILIDEIETSLHPDLALRLADVLRDESLRLGKQIIATTHSDLIVASAEADELLVMTPDHSRGYELWSARRPSATDERALESALDALGVSAIGPSSLRLLGARVVVVVEGKTDATLLTSLARRAGIDDFDRLRAIPVPLGGVDRVMRAADATKVLLNAHVYPKALICVMDRDERSNAEIETEKAKAAPAILHVLERREIENYLLDVGAITRVLRAGARRGQEEVDEGLVAEKLAELADACKFQTQCRRAVSRLYRKKATKAQRTFAKELERESPGAKDEFESLLAEVDEESDQSSIRGIWREVGEQLDNVWEEQRLHLAPGGAVLSSLRAWSQEQFRHAPSAGSIVGQLAELPEELMRLCRRIQQAAAAE